MPKSFLKSGLLGFLGAMLFLSQAGALEKLKFGTSVKTNYAYNLPIIAGQEVGFWKQNGLEVEWVPFATGAATSRALAAGHINIYFATAIFQILNASRGLPVIMVAEGYVGGVWGLWVLSTSPLKDPRAFRGAKVSVSGFGAISHSFAQMAAKSLGIEKQVTYVAVGGVQNQVAALKSGVVDALTLSDRELLELIDKGEVRLLLDISAYIPQPWLDSTVGARKAFVKENPGTVRNAVRALLLAYNFLLKNPQWVIEALKSWGYSDRLARLSQERLAYNKEGTISRAAVENLTKFIADYRLAPREKIPPLDELFTNEFVR